MSLDLDELYERLVPHQVHGWSSGYLPRDMTKGQPAEEKVDVRKADVISSLHRTSGDLHAILLDVGPRHAILLDVDIPAAYIPSTTEGHGHLYIDVPGGVKHEAYMRLLDALEECGVLEPGYVGASKRRGYTSLRPYWAKKSDRPILRCCRCGKRPEEIGEYVRAAQEGMSEADVALEPVTPEEVAQYVWDNEGTLNSETGEFACTSCYIELGQPTAPNGWTPGRDADPRPIF